MRKLFLIPLMVLCTCVMAWAGNQPEPKAFAFYQADATMKKAQAHRAPMSLEDQEVLLEYEGFSQTFNSLQAAFNALPENSTPAIVTLHTDVDVDYEGACLRVAAFQRVTLELNGHGIYGTTDAAISTVVIENRGNLTINDAVGTGIITNLAANPDVDWSADNEAHPYPTYANNVINNRGNGVLTINGGLIKNETGGAAAYPIDVYDNSTLIVNGGHIYNYFSQAIRCFGSSNSAHTQNVTINGGLLEGYCAIWLQMPSANVAPKINLNVNGGELRTTAKAYTNGTKTIQQVGTYIYDWGNGLGDNISFNITGGTFNENIAIYKGAAVNISGGNFNGFAYIADQSRTIIYGGIFDKSTYYGLNLKPGYVWKYVGSTENENPLDDELYEVVPAGQAVINKDTLDANNNEYELKDIEQHLDEGETLEATIVSIVGAGGAAAEAGDTVKVTINTGDTVEVNGISGAAEGQLVVKDGATLVIGNGGIVSTNDTLTQIVVEAGGTVAVGTGGVNKQGDATPIEIQSDGDKSGVLLIDPNAPAEVAEALAKVVVYTRAHKDNGMEYWQQFASPVKGNTIKVTPLGELQGNHNFMTSLYSWDYATDSWVRVTDGMEEISEGVYAFRGDVVWTTSDAVLKPFAAYDLINNSHDYHGGVTYEFAGELVGNGDMVLSFPENGFCTFGNSYTAPIDLESFFETVKNDIQYDYDNNNNLIATSAIDPCVYIFNSAKNCFESVNQAAIKLWKKGIKTPAFTQIPPQQAFVMNLLKGNSGQSAVNYAASVWGNPNANQNVPIKAPKLAEETSTLSALLEITVTDGNATDRVMLIEDEEYSNEYDFGADAVKYMNGSFNLYANTTIGQLDMVATDNIENTELSFKAGNAVNYTISFNNVEGDFVLIDHANNSQVAIEEGGIYTFATQPNVTAENRFAIVPAAKMPTAIENTEVKANVKGIYTIMGQYLGEDFDVLPAGVYVIDGVKIVK